MTERKQGHSKLVYDKETRTIKTVDPHPAALAAAPAEPKGTWTDGGKVWEAATPAEDSSNGLAGAALGRWCYENPGLAAMTIEGLRAATPAVGGEASERLDVIASWLMGEAFCADWHDDPDMGVRECMRIKALFIDRINEFVCDEIKRATQPAPPLRGREAEAVSDAIMGAARLYTHDHATACKITEMAMDAIFSAAPPITEDEVFDLLYENVELKVSDCLPEIVGYDKFVKALLDRSAVPEQPAADPVTRREETITKCLKIIGIHEFSARQGVRSAMGPKVRQQALAAEAALQAVAKDIRALSTAQDKRGPSTSGSPVFPGGTSDDLDIEPIEGAKP